MYNYVLLKMSTWYSKHVEESNNIWRINNIQCITLVFLYAQFMMHGQRNIKQCSVVATSRPLLKLAQFFGRWCHFPVSPLQVCTQSNTFYYKCSVLKSQWDILQETMLFRLELLLPWHATDYSCSIWLPMLRKTSKFSARTPSWLAKLQTTELPNMKQSPDLWHSEWVHKPSAQVELELPWRVFTARCANFPKHCDTSGQMYCT